MDSSLPVFSGYRRKNGQLGIRNKVLVMSITGLTGPAAREIGVQCPQAQIIAMPFGTGLITDDRAAHLRTLEGLACNANVASVLLISDHVPKLNAMAELIEARGQTVVPLSLDEYGQDHIRLVDAGVTVTRRLLTEAKSIERTPAALSDLCIGLKCGRSDPSSGLVANPMTGRIVDRIIQGEGTAIFGEVVEWIGAEHLIAERAATPDVAKRLTALPREREIRAVTAGLDLLGSNPSPTNIASGLSTIEEKSLGGISKTGTMPIVGVLDYGQPPDTAGLFAMDTPNYAPEHLTALSAAGCQVHIFTTGAGNPFVNGQCPTLKVSANPVTCETLPHQIDVDLSGVLELGMQETDAVEKFWTELIDILNGRETCGELARTGDDVISRFGAAL